MADRFETDTDALGNLLAAVNERLVPEGSFKTQLTEVLSIIKEKGLRALIEVCVPSGAGRCSVRRVVGRRAVVAVL